MRRRNRSIALVTICLFCIGLRAERGLAQRAAPEAYDQLARAAYEKLHPPGLSVAVVVAGEQVFASGYGLADLENDVPCTAQTVYRIASISKPIAAIAVLQVVEQGRAALDDSITNFVPEFPAKPEGPVTLQRLLTHTSGIRHYKPGEFEQTRHYDTLAAAIEIFKDDPLLFAPGTRFSYTTYGYNLLAGVIEHTAHQSFGDYLHERVFAPAGMTSSRLELQGELVPRRARQYVRGADQRWQNAPFVDLSIKWAGGGVISTVEDLCRLHVALESGKLLKPESIALMQTPATTLAGQPLEYGLGWNIATDKQGRTWVSHSGGTTGGTSFLLRCPDQRCAVAVIANGGNVEGLPGLARRLALTALSAGGTAPADEP
ncbi:MAG: beta-lactamase family protein [Pirellulales bacterium]|nr:beta-lactamase family protein [Pirellulales bacterium]